MWKWSRSINMFQNLLIFDLKLFLSGLWWASDETYIENWVFIKYWGHKSSLWISVSKIFNGMILHYCILQYNFLRTVSTKYEIFFIGFWWRHVVHCTLFRNIGSLRGSTQFVNALDPIFVKWLIFIKYIINFCKCC